MNYNLCTTEGMNNAVAWTRKCFDQIKDGGRWIVPRSMTIVTVNHNERIATITEGLVPDPSIKRVIEAMGWTVIEK